MQKPSFVNGRVSTTACQPPLKCQPVDRLTGLKPPFQMQRGVGIGLGHPPPSLSIGDSNAAAFWQFTSDCSRSIWRRLLKKPKGGVWPEEAPSRHCAEGFIDQLSQLVVTGAILIDNIDNAIDLPLGAARQGVDFLQLFRREIFLQVAI